MAVAKQIAASELGVVKNPRVAGGAPVIRGTRVRVKDIVIEFVYLAKTPDEIVQARPHLTLAQVHAALAYYYSNVAQTKREIEADESFVARLRRNSGR